TGHESRHAGIGHWSACRLSEIAKAPAWRSHRVFEKRRDVPLRTGFCDAPLANNEVRPETLETRGSERFGMDFVPKENVESQRGPKSRRNPRSDVERRVACRVHRCYRRGLVSITFPAGWPSRRALEARPGLSSGRQPLNSRIVTSELPVQDGRHICTSKIESSSSAEFPRPRPVQALSRGVYCK